MITTHHTKFLYFMSYTSDEILNKNVILLSTTAIFPATPHMWENTCQKRICMRERKRERLDINNSYRIVDIHLPHMETGGSKSIYQDQGSTRDGDKYKSQGILSNQIVNDVGQTVQSRQLNLEAKAFRVCLSKLFIQKPYCAYHHNIQTFPSRYSSVNHKLFLLLPLAAQHGLDFNFISFGESDRMSCQKINVAYQKPHK